jgi:hypothetical protein
MPRPRRIIERRKPGITDDRGAYYHGAHAGKIVRERARQLAEEKARKKASRGTRPPKVRSPHSQLKRLERALTKRKTLAARVRVQSQIDVLKHELGLDA